MTTTASASFGAVEASPTTLGFSFDTSTLEVDRWLEE